VSRRLYLSAALALTAGMAMRPMAHAVGLADGGERAAGFAGSFIQLWQRHHHWDAGDWDALFDTFSALGLRVLVVQWTRVDGLRFDRSLRGADSPDHSTPLEAILRRAQDNGLTVMVGLDHEASWWACARLDATALQVYLARRALGSLALARSLLPRLEDQPCFGGWYLSEEIDPMSFASHRARSALRGFLQQLGAGLRRLTPGATVGVSGFAPAGSQPDACAHLWGELLSGIAPVDRLLIQDGIGVGAQTLDGWARRLRELRQVAESVRTPGGGMLQLWPVVEAFAQTAGPGIDAAGFTARPAHVDRLVQQLQLAAGVGCAIAFSVPDYLVPQAGPEASALYENYLRLGLRSGPCDAGGIESVGRGR
jgi:hypothetical protein